MARPRPLRYSCSMPKDDEKLIRQLSLVSFLLNRPRPSTGREIQSVVEGYQGMLDTAFARRFFQDRQDLEVAGILIESAKDSRDETVEVYYLPEENYHLPDLSFTQEELRALTVALALLRGRFAYERPLLLALACLTHGRSSPLEVDTDGLAVSLSADAESEGALKALARFEEAVSRGKTLCFDYYSMYRDASSTRTLDPYCLLRMGGHWYTVGRDHGSGAIRMFRLGRIEGPITFATKNPRDFHVPADFRADDYRARPPWLLAQAQGVARFRVAEDLAWWVERSFPRVRREERDDVDGMPWVTFSTEYSDPDQLLAWIIGLGDRVRLLTPPQLRARLKAALEVTWRAHCDLSEIADPEDHRG